jgi:hypothetical protein
MDQPVHSSMVGTTSALVPVDGVSNFMDNQSEHVVVCDTVPNVDVVDLLDLIPLVAGCQRLIFPRRNTVENDTRPRSEVLTSAAHYSSGQRVKFLGCADTRHHLPIIPRAKAELRIHLCLLLMSSKLTNSYLWIRLQV